MPGLDRSVGGSTAFADEVQNVESGSLPIDALPFPILLLDRAGQRLRINPAASVLLDHDGVSIAIDEIAGRLAGGASSITQDIQDHRGRTWHVAGVPAQTAGSDWRYTILAQDVTTVLGKREADSRAKNTAATSALVAAVVHTVRNPLFVLSATLEAFDAVHGFPLEAREYLDPLRQQVDRLETIMRGLLEYGRPLQADASPGWLGQAIWRAIDGCRPLAERCGVSVVTEPGSEWAPLPMDSRLITQAFRHLIENAIEHSPQFGTVRIEGDAVTIHGREWAECRIVDEGPGFREQDMARLFQPFASRREGRPGLGLALCRRIVEEHGGQVTAGNNPDGGAWVNVCLPLLEGSDGR